MELNLIEENPFKPLRQLLVVESAMLPDTWPAALPLLEEGKAYWENWTTLEIIYERLTAGTLQLWLMNDEDEFLLAMLTEIQLHPNYKSFNIKWMGGCDLDSALENCFDEFVNLWASREGCSRVRLEGRKGWTRKLLPLGFKVKSYVMERDISEIKEH